MGGNVSKTTGQSYFTSEQAYSIAADINSKIEDKKKADASSSSESTNKNIKISNVKGSTIKISAEATARMEIAQASSFCLDYLSSSDITSTVALDIMNGLSNAAKQAGGGMMDKTESENITSTTYNLNTAISCCQNLTAVIGAIAIGKAEAKALNENIDISNIENSTIQISAVAYATTLIKQLGDYASKSASEMKSASENGLTDYTTMTSDADQKGALEGLNEFGTNLTNKAADVANNVVDEVGETTREGIGMPKWLIIGPIIGIIAIIALIVVFKLVRGSNNKDLEMRKLELELENKRLQQMQLQQMQPQ